MQIVFYTPPLEVKWRRFTYVPHLVEHCVWRSKEFTLENHFLYNVDLIKEFLINHSIYTAENNSMKNEYVRYLCKTLDPYIIEQEKEIIAQEIDEYPETDDSLLRTIEADLYNNKYIEDETIELSNDEIVEYHHKRYHPDFAISCNENFDLMLPKKRHEIEKDLDENIYQSEINFLWGEWVYLYTSNTCWKSYYKILFIKEAISAYTRYIYRFKDISDFDYPLIDRYMSLDHWIVGIPNSAKRDIPKDFFNTFKNHFIRQLFIDYDTSEYCYYNLLEKGTVTKKKILAYIQTFSYSLLQ